MKTRRFFSVFLLVTLLSRYCYQLLYAHRNKNTDNTLEGNSLNQLYKVEVAIVGAGNVGIVGKARQHEVGSVGVGEHKQAVVVDVGKSLIDGSRDFVGENNALVVFHNAEKYVLVSNRLNLVVFPKKADEVRQSIGKLRH